MKKAKLVPVRNIVIEDKFWGKFQKLVKEEVLEYQWKAMNDQIEGAEKSHCLANFRIAAGEEEGDFYGAAFQDSDLAKWIEAAAYISSIQPNEGLKQKIDEAVTLIEKTQQPDGYFNTYFILKAPDEKFQNLCEGHELYTLGHMIEAAVACYEVLGDKRLLGVVCKMADLVYDTFGDAENKRYGVPGHQEIELALVKLYEVTGKKEYLELAKYFIDARGQKDYFRQELEKNEGRRIFPEFYDYRPEYSQSHLPVREQKAAEGHAVRAVYMYSAMADLAYEYQDEELFLACGRLWNNIVKKRMYITGGIGSSGILERFTTDYDLPNAYNYAETCASVGLALFGRRMTQITRNAQYYDVVERALYNTVLAGMAMDGKSFFYVNPLEVWPPSCIERTSKEHVKSIRQKWFSVACCPSNIARTLGSLGQYIYCVEGSTLYVNMYIGNEAEIPLDKGHISVHMKSWMPWRGHVVLEVQENNGAESLALRIPEYALNYQITINDKACDFNEDNGYAIVKNIERGQQIIIDYEMLPQYVYANPNVREDEGKVCMMYGPLVYALEEQDNQENLQSYYIKTDVAPEKIWSEDLFGGSYVLQAEAKRIQNGSWKGEELYSTFKPKYEDTKITAIPYAFWCNRVPGEMLVWIKEWMQ